MLDLAAGGARAFHTELIGWIVSIKRAPATRDAVELVDCATFATAAHCAIVFPSKNHFVERRGWLPSTTRTELWNEQEWSRWLHTRARTTFRRYIGTATGLRSMHSRASWLAFGIKRAAWARSALRTYFWSSLIWLWHVAVRRSPRAPQERRRSCVTFPTRSTSSAVPAANAERVKGYFGNCKVITAWNDMNQERK